MAQPRPPEVIAHRGSSWAEPEHTAEAYLRAIAEGADALECDVRLTADQHLVCVHDRRIQRTSNGVGRVSTSEIAELEGLDWGSWWRPGEAAPGPRRLLTLRKLLEIVREHGRPIGLAIETKHPTRYGGAVEQRLAAMLTELGLGAAPDIRLMSFSALAVRRMRQLLPDLPAVFLLENELAGRFADGVLPWGATVAGLDVRLVRRKPAIVRSYQRRGHQVLVWTVDELADIELCLELGVNGIITNRPALVRDRVRLTG